MEWQAIVLAMQIMLLAVGWLLFQKARGELSARAAETPVLTEVKALQRSVKLLLAEIEKTSDKQSERIEQRCEEARLLVQTLECRMADAESLLQQPVSVPQEIQAVVPDAQSPRRKNAGTVESRFANGRRSYRKEYGFQQDTDEQEYPRAEAGPLPQNISRSSSDGFSGRSVQEERRQAIFRLADAGQSLAAIARETNLSEGEVETILSLRMKRP